MKSLEEFRQAGTDLKNELTRGVLGVDRAGLESAFNLSLGDILVTPLETPPPYAYRMPVAEFVSGLTLSLGHIESSATMEAEADLLTQSTNLAILKSQALTSMEEAKNSLVQDIVVNSDQTRIQSLATSRNAVKKSYDVDVANLMFVSTYKHVTRSEAKTHETEGVK